MITCRSRIIDLTTHHIRKSTCCISFIFTRCIQYHANNEILYFEIYNVSRIITFNERTYTKHLNNMLWKCSFCTKRTVILNILNKFFVYFLSCVFQVNRENSSSAFSEYQAKLLSYPIVYQSYRIVRETCSIVRVFYRIVR